MLTEEGILLDLHPIPPSMHVFSAGRDLGAVDEREFFRVVRATDRELRKTVAEGLFSLEAETELDVIERFDTAEELFETVEEWGDIHFSKRLHARIARSTPPIDLHERLVLRRYRRTRRHGSSAAGRPQPPSASASSAGRSSGAVYISSGHFSRGRSRYSSIPFWSGSRR
jgi:hypothetical protein